MKRSQKNMLYALLAVAVVYYFFYCRRSGFEEEEPIEDSSTITGSSVDPVQYASTDPSPGTAINLGCAMNSGTGLASSLLPQETAPQEDFSELSPDEVLKGQNFLDPRQQIGFPETLGGSLRNSNQSIRAETPNPKQAYEWNNSTIVPDLMQRKLC